MRQANQQSIKAVVRISKAAAPVKRTAKSNSMTLYNLYKIKTQYLNISSIAIHAMAKNTEMRVSHSLTGHWMGTSILYLVRPIHKFMC